MYLMATYAYNYSYMYLFFIFFIQKIFKAFLQNFYSEAKLSDVKANMIRRSIRNELIYSLNNKLIEESPTAWT